MFDTEIQLEKASSLKEAAFAVYFLDDLLPFKVSPFDPDFLSRPGGEQGQPLT